jgi:hypothetical protein
VPAGVFVVDGLTLSENLDTGAVTMRAAVIEWLSDPLTPVIVTVDVPVGVEDVVCTVKVLVAFVFGLGEKLAVAPDGNPDAESVTGLLKPFEALTETEYVAAVPAVTDALDGLAPSEKSAFCDAA